MASENPFLRIARQVEALPADERPSALAEAIGHAIPFVGTAGLRVETLTPTRVVARLSDRRGVHNHIGGLHAGALALLAETVTGLVVAINVRADCVPVLRSLQVDYRRRAEGELRAEATLSEEAAERIRTTEIGRLDVAATVTDANDEQPITNAMEWAWLPKRKALG